MKTNRQGISLIVLIITIVIMVIIAAVIILTLSGSDIINNAESAKDTSNDAALYDAAVLAYSEWMSDKTLAASGIDAKTYVAERLRELEFSDEQIARVSIEEGLIKIKVID